MTARFKKLTVLAEASKRTTDAKSNRPFSVSIVS